MSHPDIPLFKSKALQWATSFDICCCLDSNSYPDPFGKFDFVIAAGATQILNIPTGQAFEALRSFYDLHKTWMFGLFSYDLKNEQEQLYSRNPDGLHFPELFFFVPKYLITIKNDQVVVVLGNQEILEEIRQTELAVPAHGNPLNIQHKLDKSAYLKKIRELQQHIGRGDIYEVTYCQEFFAKPAEINPLQVFNQLNNVSPTPFAGYFKIYDQYILSASPERFLCKREDKLISQPIKGTAKRHPDGVTDEQVKLELSHNLKEQAENVMIVDLVRNDLTKSAVKGTVKVEELFGIYSFPQVHQMISTISCELKPELHFIDAIKNTFPMGSMTGAPKIRAMELIESHELSKRGAYSGSIGYISPEEEFDFNVIIRSILYQETEKYLSFQVGGAITYASSPEGEYEECMVKASAIIQTLAQ
ncbi:para-aminobenzoate synthetase component 1 [Pedobacter steynii]|uniref:Para-aminobenzoate synthetase component 1 n=1 Tax=Pedobacter steynii TaxID=430522 RepID=A0A1G9T309_9SPHI|nr:anthranilate synthase component I family protein [Pedobacter steynii]NQX37251.1 anthranilate synthase component I family protein [Pedobacter steynii]SDM42113.1 para-aminobenzoate synthetase component 1 [Pedobacter steynii]